MTFELFRAILERSRAFGATQKIEKLRMLSKPPKVLI